MLKTYSQVNLQLVDSYLSVSRKDQVTASLQLALVNGSTQLNCAGSTQENEV